MTRELYVIRPGKEEDRNFFLATFTQGLFSACPCHRATPRPIFLESWANPRVRKLLEDPLTQSLVACLPDKDSVILGYILFQPPSTVLWIHVKSEFMRMGIARELWTKANLEKPVVSLSWTRAVKELMLRMEVTYNPYLVP